MQKLKHYTRQWFLPMVATAGFLLLLTHKSELPLVFNRYSSSYTFLLILFALNLALFWRRAVLLVHHPQEIEQPFNRALLPSVILFITVAFLLDFVFGSLDSLKTWIIITLLGGVLVQINAWLKHFTIISTYSALVASSLAFAVVLLESIFVLFLLESRTPKNQREFLRLMTSSEMRQNSGWPQPISVPKPLGTFRILGLADSFGTFGGITTNYHYLLEGILRRDVSPRIQMINLSVPGYNPLRELVILRRFGMDYSPDLVLHSFDAGHDFSLSDDDVYIYRSVPINYPQAFRYRPRHFLVRGWIENSLWRLQDEWRRQREPKREFLKVQLGRMNLWAKRSDKDVQRMKEIFPVLDAVRSTAEQNGTYYAIVIHPDETQFNDKLRQEIITAFQVNEADYDFDLPQKLLRSYCAERRVACLDLLPIFRAKTKNGDLYMLRDTHYNQDGQELAATSISQFLHDRQLLSSVRPTIPGQVKTGN